MNKIFNILILFIFVGTINILGNNCEQKSFGESIGEQNVESAQEVFKEIEKGISEGNVSSISGFFSSQIYLSLSNGVNGYYSSNQAYYVLQGYFKNYYVITFSLKNVHDEDESIYATGVYTYSIEGKEGKAQVYISLKHAGPKWKITQLTID